MIKGIIVLIGIVVGFFFGAVVGFMVGMSPDVISMFTELFFARSSGGFFGDSFNAVVFTLPLFALAGSVSGGWLGYRFGGTYGLGVLKKKGEN
ncbi:hypothetical protein [Marinobacter sp.]|uniref:hypothetical protein n=1 Tax=Marinobacter sp. TaxID=50741 RepID=UPI001B4330A2|nr:hypothetical protein [Marinobacter sp.]MBQ0831776.1 hypothetical protein [Marinobacter sp.]